MAKALTVKTLENLKPMESRQEVPDGLVRGLYFVLQPSGKASWAVRYRSQRITRKLTLGTYPAVDLKAARELASRALVNVAGGGDPAADKKAAKAAAPDDRDLVQRVADQFIERYAKANAPRSWAETKRILDKEVVAQWGSRRLSEIRRADVHDLLDAVVDRGAPIMANRVLAALRRMCSWAVDRDIIATSPCQGVKPPSSENSRERALSDCEVAAVWKACDQLGWPFGPLIQLLILTAQRREEVGAMQWSEIDFEGKAWMIPKERAKNDVGHFVPLSPQAVEILDALPRIEAPRGYPDHVFTMGGGQSVSGFSKAKRRVDELVAEIAGAPLPHWVLHDFRRTFASGCARLGINLPVIEKVLNHVSGSFGGIVGVYQRYSFADEKRYALELWADHVRQLRGEDRHAEHQHLTGSGPGGSSS